MLQWCEGIPIRQIEADVVWYIYFLLVGGKSVLELIKFKFKELKYIGYQNAIARVAMLSRNYLKISLSLNTMKYVFESYDECRCIITKIIVKKKKTQFKKLTFSQMTFSEMPSLKSIGPLT